MRELGAGASRAREQSRWVHDRAPYLYYVR